MKNPPLLVIVGETASGKSSLAMALAKKLDAEIICADSWTVRREANIGTDKPSAADRKTVKHHMADIVDPCQDFTAAVYKDMANSVINEISLRGKLPILVGGSGLYIDGVIYNYSFLKAGDRKQRQKLNELSLNELLAIAKSISIDLENIDLNNKRRVIRAIEVNGEKPQKDLLRPNTLIIGISMGADDQRQAIENRVDNMISQGLEKEVLGLVEKYGWNCEALKGVGYSQWKGYFEGRIMIHEVRQLIINATVNLSKKQRTWFKRNKSIHWYAQPVNLDDIVELITTQLAR